MRWRRLGLRARLMLLGVLGLSGGLLLGGLVLLAVLNFALHRAVDQSARQTAQGVAKIIQDQEGIPEVVPVSGADAIVQVVDGRSAVRTAARNLVVLHDSARHYKDQLLPARERIVQETQLMYNAMSVGAS